jgi:hypothetical protein
MHERSAAIYIYANWRGIPTFCYHATMIWFCVKEPKMKGGIYRQN